MVNCLPNQTKKSNVFTANEVQPVSKIFKCNKNEYFDIKMIGIVMSKYFTLTCFEIYWHRYSYEIYSHSK